MLRVSWGASVDRPPQQKMNATRDAIEAEVAAKGLTKADRLLEIFGDRFDSLIKVRIDFDIYLAVLI